MPPASHAGGLGLRWGCSRFLPLSLLGPHHPPTCSQLILKVGAGGGGPACTMNPWLLVCLVSCFVVAWAPTVHAQGTDSVHPYPHLWSPLSPSFLCLPLPICFSPPPETSPMPSALNPFSDGQLPQQACKNSQHLCSSLGVMVLSLSFQNPWVPPL